ncbi:MAG: lipoyl(octanoyl) transferase LipB [Anaeromicrobium sp.]|jgi:lipoyl(octanoyl) transferase|uniref:lipoyl(octanoyl) transferase LipB n=1 Tax=Anaeromicrobium sp. TaxID=1929132 RepID=UPI0025EB8558|nr:lipoyl(octanoyl) transferase LipB [Anaeromicrobium sp.]MCT4594768.1 lipoyl(octanoyl) transferase LipB [Anaeromicrobium sp.]
MIDILDLGVCEYEEALNIQLDLLKKRQADEINDTLILVEHPSVITMGRRAEKGNILGSKAVLEENGVGVFESNRGGDVTYHGPGQIVGYAIFKLKRYQMSIRQFVWNIEDTFIKLLKDEYNINANRDFKNTGVWVGNNKIVAVGLAVKRGVTMHGFAFNVNTELSHFNFIVPCGIHDKGVTSVKNIIGKEENLEEVKDKVIKHFKEVFNKSMKDVL